MLNYLGAVHWSQCASDEALLDAIEQELVTRRPVPRQWRIEQAQRLRLLHGDLEPCECADCAEHASGQPPELGSQTARWRNAQRSR